MRAAFKKWICQIHWATCVDLSVEPCPSTASPSGVAPFTAKLCNYKLPESLSLIRYLYSSPTNIVLYYH